MHLGEIHKRLAKEKNIPIYIRGPILIFSSWLFQGILYMDVTEKIFKFFIDILLFVPLYGICRYLVDTPINVITAAILAHTLNWIFNGQIFVLLKNLGLTKIRHEQVIKYLDNLRKRIPQERSILAAAVFGSLSRNELKITSDLDIRIIRKKGIINGLRACLFALLERSRAFFNRFPLDIYVLDKTESLMKLRIDEAPIILFDAEDIFRSHYGNNIRLNNSQVRLNNGSNK